LLLKSLEFKHVSGQKVKITEIPVLEENSTFRFMLSAKLDLFIRQITNESVPKQTYSFQEYLKRVLKWKDYEQLFKSHVLKHNA
jgi:hypothetical protein